MVSARTTALFCVAVVVDVSLALHVETTGSFFSQRRHLDDVMANMTTALAFRSLPSPLPKVVEHALAGLELSDNVAAPSEGVFLQARESRSRVAVRSLRSSASVESADPNTARPLLNAMGAESMRKLDEAQATCVEGQEASGKMMTGARQDMKEYDAQGAANRARVVLAETNIASMTQRLPALSEALRQHQAKCDSDAAAVNSQITLMDQDHGTLAQIVSSTQCAPTTALLQCHRAADAALLQGGSAEVRGHFAFGQQSLRRKGAKLQSKFAQRSLQSALADVYKTGKAVANSSTFFLQMHQYHGHRRVHRHAQSRRFHTHRRARHASRHGRHHLHLKQLEALGNHSEAWWNAARCATVDNPDCDMVKERFMLMQAGVVDKKEDLQDQVVKLLRNCDQTHANYQAQMDDLQTRLKDQQMLLAEATKVIVETEEQSRLKKKQLSDLELESKRTLSACHRNIDGLTQEICSVRQIRSELYKMNSDTTFIQDCVVSDWLPQECSAQCGGGVMRMTRAVVVPPSLGMQCPPLEMERRCNEQSCPIDCDLDAWGGWSACSAGCGGGVKQRVRSVARQAQFNGRPCGATSESATCNLEACDLDCKLAPWTEWSTCSKACDSGFLTRSRAVMEAPRGAGLCPGEDNLKRLQYRRCNTHVCEPSHGEILECHAKLDVVLLMDGSASLGENGWAAMKTAAASVVGAFKTDGDKAQVALLLFSGPENWADYERCTSGTEQDVNMMAVCKIIWASHFTTDTEGLARDMDRLIWPKATALTSAALATAESELRAGRTEAQAVVLVLTDSVPMNKRKTFQAAQSLRKKARVIWVPVTPNAPLQDMKEWSSRPVADNIVPIASFDELTQPGNINRIIADACPVVE